LLKGAMQKLIKQVSMYNVSKLQYSNKLIHYHSINQVKENLNASYLQTSRQAT